MVRTKETITRINKDLENFELFGIDNSYAMERLGQIVDTIAFLRQNGKISLREWERYHNRIEELYVRQECLEEERASVGNFWW